MHLPLSSPAKIDYSDFRAHLNKLFESGKRDFACVSFVGAEGPAIYENLREGNYRDCNVGANVHLHHIGEADWSHSCFYAGRTVITSAQSLTCRDATFEGSAEFNCAGSSHELDLSGSVFRAACRLVSISSLKTLRLDRCEFSRALTIYDTSNIPQETSCSAAHFRITVEDEGNFRVLRNLFSNNRARELEGKFYSLEQRSRRLGLSWRKAAVPRTISWLYDVISEYGQSYSRALFWFCALQFVFAFGYAIAFERMHILGTIDGKVIGFTFAQLVRPFELFTNRVGPGSVFEIVPTNARGWWMFWTALQSVASLVVAALFLLALRWRFRRE
jgi:hypothetical protein